jgi:CDP-diacylglycerol--serine O-phosphatidyltransferase
MTRKEKFKRLIENNKWLKKVPNTLTICNSLCGFGAIIYTLHAYDETSSPEVIFAFSAWLILAAMVFDALDGFAARIFNAASMHGIQMDSLADMVTFGLSPAVLVAIIAHRLSDKINYSYNLVWMLCAIYIGCAALRLATYNVHAILEHKSDGKFYGLPSPGAAAAVCSLIIFYSMRDGEILPLISFLPIYAAFLGFLMVSRVRYIHIGKWIQGAKRHRSRLILIIALIISLLWQPISTLLFRKETQEIWFPQFFTVAVINLYVLSGPFYTLYLKIAKK